MGIVQTARLKNRFPHGGVATRLTFILTNCRFANQRAQVSLAGRLNVDLVFDGQTRLGTPGESDRLIPEFLGDYHS
jgi:hypothetical protein